MLRAAAPPQALLLGALLWHLAAGYTDLPTAVNITWSSINFKTILQWQPKPSGYFYTVEIHGQTSDVKRKCILTSETECDVTDVLRNVKETYTAHILSVEPAEMDNFEEPPFAVSEKFIPYSQTVIGKPEIKDYSQKGSKLNVVFKDPLTPYIFPNGSFLSIQDIFQHDLEYKLYYWKDQSSGKKDVTTKSHNFEVSVDSGKNYCFYVQGIIPSRRENRNGQESMVLCTSVERNILDGCPHSRVSALQDRHPAPAPPSPAAIHGSSAPARTASTVSHRLSRNSAICVCFLCFVSLEKVTPSGKERHNQHINNPNVPK